MSRDHLLGLDLGTTRASALLVASDGSVLGRSEHPVPTQFPGPGRVEQDPQALFEVSLTVLREALAQARVGADQVAGLGLATQRATTVAWNRRTGEPLAPAIGWQDQRTAERVEELRALGIPITTLPSATKFEWWLRLDEAIRRAAADGTLCLGTPDAWLTFRFSGGHVHGTDPGQASCTGLYDLERGCYMELALDLFGIDEECLPRLLASSAVVSEMPRELLGAALPLAARAGDQQAAAFAQAVHEPGDAKLTLGTSAMLDVHGGFEPSTPAPGVLSLALWKLGEEQDAFLHEGTVVTAGAVIDWLVQLGLLSAPEALDTVAGQASGGDTPFFVPALLGLGTPFLETSARGLLGGLDRSTSAGQIVRAAVEGIAQRCADMIEAVALPRLPLRVDGGLARSRTLLQSLADVSGRPIHRAAETETTALGAALLAGFATGLLPTLAACRAVLDSPERHTPRLPEGHREASRARWRERLELVR